MECVKEPKTELVLVQVPELTPTYSDTYDFRSKEIQWTYFMTKKTIMTFKNYTYLRKDSAIKVGKHIDDLHGYNYCIYKNREKLYYCFIMKKEYINEQTTMLHITTDIMQTYLFDFKLLESHVDRCHVDRWTKEGLPTNEFEPEGLEYGENIQYDTQKLKEFTKSYIAVCSSPLGLINGRKKENPDDDEGGASGDWVNGKPSGDGFYFVKSWEAFAPWQYNLGDGTLTVGYGTTSRYNPTEFAELTANPPCTETQASVVMYNKLVGSYNKPIVERLKQLGITEQYQADALFSLAYNSGTGSVTDDNNLTNVIKVDPKNESFIRPVWETFKIMQGSPFEQGLRERRKAECDVFFNKGYGNRRIPVYGKDGRPSGKYVEENGGKGWMPS